MDRFVFHGVDKDHGDFYKYAKDRDKAMQYLEPRILNAALHVLSNSVLTIGAEMTNVFLS